MYHIRLYELHNEMRMCRVTGTSRTVTIETDVHPAAGARLTRCLAAEATKRTRGRSAGLLFFF
jgi:hypothetical protein